MELVRNWFGTPLLRIALEGLPVLKEGSDVSEPVTDELHAGDAHDGSAAREAAPAVHRVFREGHAAEEATGLELHVVVKMF
jgi:hypothetical protein